MFNVMVVDDEKSMREGLQKFLARQEDLFDEVYTAANGVEAVQLLKEKQPQVIVTDINMPHMDGLEFIELLKAQRQDVKIIVISGYDDFSYAQRAMRSGVEHYLLKPVDRRELIEVLRKTREEYYDRIKARQEDVEEKERVQKQQKLLCDRFLGMVLKGPVEKEEWRFELELLDLWKDDITYTVCIANDTAMQGDQKARERHKEALEENCDKLGIRMLAVQEDEEAAVLLLAADSPEKAAAMAQWIEQQKEQAVSVGTEEIALKFGGLVKGIAEIHLSYDAARKDSMVEQQDIANRALRLIGSKWNDPKLTLNDIAGELYVSHNYLRYLIKEKTGMSFVKYVTELRLERAALILSTTDMKVQEVALEVGFEDAGYFTRVFTKKYECSPSKYRERK